MHASPLRILNRDGVLAYLVTSRTTLHRLIRDGCFPPGFAIDGNPQAPRWLEREARDFVALAAGNASKDEMRQWARNAIAARKRLRRD